MGKYFYGKKTKNAIQLECSICSNVFHRLRSNIRPSKSGKLFCSRKCSEQNRVSMVTVPDEKRYKINKKSGCWEWQMGKRNDFGYSSFNNGSGHTYFYEKYKGKIPKGLVLDHLCRNPGCVNPGHLEAVTVAVNTQRGLVAKLNPEKVRTIREMLKEGAKGFYIASVFDVSSSQISAVKHRRTWANIA